MKTFLRMSQSLGIAVVFLALLAYESPGALAADTNSEANPATAIGLGAGSFLLSVPYGAVKIATAILGGVAGGVTYLFDKKAAESVWHTTLGGDYVITPDHLTGKRALRFSGAQPEDHRSPS